MFEVMDVRAANSGLSDFDKDLIAFDLGDGTLDNESAGPLSPLLRLNYVRAGGGTHVLVLDVVDSVKHEAWVI